MKGYKKYIQGSRYRNSQLFDVLRKEVHDYGYNRISVCAAYATLRGVILLRSLLADNDKPSFRWLLGIDDNITDPNAIHVASSSFASQVKLITLLPDRRFHPKVYMLDSKEKNRATLIISSANLTESGLKNNCEVFAVQHANSKKQCREFFKYWDCLWNMGISDYTTLLSDYSMRHKKARRQLPRLEQLERTPSFTGDIQKANVRNISTASLIWIELGRNTGGGSQLEIVKDMSPFLNLPKNPTKGETCNRNITTLKGTKQYKLTFTKGMWRFMSLQKGFDEPLRPDLSKPSPYILVVEKNKSGPKLTMRIIKKSRAAAVNIITQSKNIGFCNKSVPGPSARQFGWL